MIHELALIMNPLTSSPIKMEPREVEGHNGVMSVNSHVVGIAFDNAHGIRPAFDTGAICSRYQRFCGGSHIESLCPACQHYMAMKSMRMKIPLLEFFDAIEPIVAFRATL